MQLYRMGGAAGVFEFSYALSSEEQRLESGLLDAFSLSSLAALITGPLTHVKQLSAAEMALKALVFHDRSKVMVPSVKVQFPANNGFTMSVPSPAAKFEGLQDITGKCKVEINLATIDRLFGFADETLAQAYLKEYEPARQKRVADRENERKMRGLPQMTFHADFTSPELVFAASSESVYFSKLTTDLPMMMRYLKPLSASGLPAYIGESELRGQFESMRNGDASQFFGPLEKNWKEHIGLLRRALNIPIPLFVAVVLNRASSRAAIPDVILELRQEFQEARETLWALFDDADFRIHDLEKSAMILKDIESAAAAVVPKAMARHSASPAIRFDLLGKLFEFNAMGLVKDIGTYIAGSTWHRFTRLDAAHLVQKELETVQLRGLLERHLTSAEITALS